MACKKTDLISAINSFGAARASGDNTLLAFSVNLVQNLIDTLEFEGLRCCRFTLQLQGLR